MSELKRKKTYAWGMVLFHSGLIGILMFGNLQVVPEESRLYVVLASIAFLVLTPILNPVIARFLDRKIGRERIVRFHQNHPYLPFLTLGLIFTPIVIALLPSEVWTRSAIGLLVVLPLCMGSLIKFGNKHSRSIADYEAEGGDTYRVGKYLQHWLLAKGTLDKSLHIGIVDDKTQKILDDDSPIPISVTKEFSTASDDQQRAVLRMYWYERGIREMAANYVVENIPKGRATFFVSFKIDSHRNLTCEVAKPLTIAKSDLVIIENKGSTSELAD